MRFVRILALRLRSLLTPARVDRDLEDELQYHLDRQAEQFEHAGMSPDAARTAALRAFGGLAQREEECREARGLVLIESLGRDLRHALRSLRRSPGFTAVAVLSLALGIGANATVFTVVDAVLLRPLPYPESARLLTLRELPPGSSTPVSVHPANFLEWRARARSFEAIALVQSIPFNIIGRDGAEQVTNTLTTADLFRVFGVSLPLGRTFTPSEMLPGGAAVAVLDYGFWQRHFAGSRAVLGRQLQTSDGSLTIVGVAPPGLRIGLTSPDLYTPLQIDPGRPDAAGSRSFECYARLRPGVAIEAARSEMALIATALGERYTFDEGYRVYLSRLHDDLVKDARPALRLLMAVVGVVLVIACVNLAGLLIARGLGRRAEFALRASLGASRGRLVRQLTIESLALAGLGGVAGVFLSLWSTRMLVRLAGPILTSGATTRIEVGWTTLLFALALTTITAFACGLVPAWQTSGLEPRSALGEHGRSHTVSLRHHRTRSALVIVETALAVALLVGAGLLLRTFAGLSRVDLGFEPARTITMRLFLGVTDAPRRIALVDDILDRVRTVPGVTAASTIQFLPLSGMTCGTGFWFEGQPAGDPTRALPTNCSIVSRDYFQTMGIPVAAGRQFVRRDRFDSPRVVIVNRAFARRYFTAGGALGRRILVAGPGQALSEIVGVVGNVRHEGLSVEPAPTVYLLHAQAPGYITNLVVRASGDPAARVADIRRAIQAVDRMQAISSIKTMDEYVEGQLARPRLYAVLVGAFAALAIVLAITGVYGLLAYVVAQRTHEIGIRLALGAAQRTVFGLVFGQGAALTLTGVVLGLLAAFGLRTLVSALLFGVTASDVTTYVAAAGLFVLVALGVAAVPAAAAARTDAQAALRHE